MMNLDAGLILDPSWTPFLCPSRSHVTGSATVGRHPSWHFNLLMTTLWVETFKMNHSLQQIVLINDPESDRIVTSSTHILVVIVHNCPRYKYMCEPDILASSL